MSLDAWYESIQSFVGQLATMVLVLLVAYMVVAWLKTHEPLTDSATDRVEIVTDASGVNITYFTSANVDTYAKVDYSMNSLTDIVDPEQTVTFDSTGLDIQYHAPLDVIEAESQTGTLTLDKDGNLVTMPWSDVSTNIMYYEPGAYKYGSTTYVPSYEDSVFLSQKQ